MAPRKNRPVLYEVVSRSRRTRGWQTPSRPGTSTETPTHPPTEPRPTQRPPAPSPVTPPRQSGEPTRSVYFADGRLYLTLGWPHLAVLGVLIVAVLYGAFEAGQRSAVAPVADGNDVRFQELLETGQQPAGGGAADLQPGSGGNENIRTPLTNETVVHREPQPAEVVQPAPPEPVDRQPPAFREDRYYVRVQCFPKSRRNAAEQARDFLDAHGVDCVVYERSADLALVALEPFATTGQARDLVRRIRELGKEYFAIAGYRFEGCEPKKF